MPTGESLLPATETLSAEQFEDFTERLLNAQKFATHGEARCVRVARWGRRGDKQDGIDFAGRLSDERRAAWQCKRYEKFTPADVRDAVEAATYLADVHHLVLSCEASSGVRDEIEEHHGWVLLDRRGLGQLLDDLPVHKRRDVLDETWGRAERQRLMRTPGEDRFVTLPVFTGSRRDATAVLNDLGPLAGRSSEIKALRAATDRAGTWPRVVIVTGPGGRGKTRLLVEALATFEARHPTVPLLVLSDGMLSDPGLVEELPKESATLVVDDAHRDPAALRRLMAYARYTDGTQLVIASRPSALASVRAEVAQDLAPDQVLTIDVGELDPHDARRLVTDVSDGTTLPFALRDHLERQATHSPHVAVIAVNLIKRGQLSGALAINAELRERVLDRYRDLTAGSVEGSTSATVNCVLAVYAALGSTNDEDADLRRRMAGVVGVTERELLAVRAALADGGVLVGSTGSMQVVPEVLADTVLEREAVVGGLDTGFTSRMWTAFGGSHGHRLMLALADLDWRLTRQNHPSVVGVVWDDFSAQLLVADLDELYTLVGTLERLATTIPDRFFSVVEALRQRLRRELDGRVEEVDRDGDGPSGAAIEAGLRVRGTAGVREARNRYGLGPVQPHDVLRRLAPLYASCATAEPDLLEDSLDALWDLRRSDQQSRRFHDDHPARAAADRICDLGRVRDGSVPGRIVGRVELWLQEAPLVDDVVTPLFALGNLTRKTGVDTEQVGSRMLQLSPYRILPERVRSLRDRMRAALQKQAGGQDLWRAADALDLLGRMLRQPDPPPRAPLTTAEVLGWEDDDLATLAALGAASRATTSAAVRRTISRLVAWSAERARSIPVRHAALPLQVGLDDHEDDDLADVLLPGGITGEPARRGVVVPDLDDFRIEVEGGRARRAALSDAEREAGDDTRIAASAERSVERHTGGAACRKIAGRLVSTASPASVVTELDRVAGEVAALQRPNQRPRTWELYRALSAVVPASVPALVHAVAGLAPGPLDADLHVLLGAWCEHDEQQLLDWLGDLRQHRPAVRVAVAGAFDTCGWHGAGQAFVSLFAQGVTDPQSEVRDDFWRASGALLSADPSATSERLIVGGASPLACAAALAGACEHDGRPWGASLSSEAAAHVLRLVDQAEWQGHTAQQVVTGIAVSHPLVVLEHIAGAHSVPLVLDGDVDGLAEALEGHGEVLARWLVDCATSRASSSRDSALAIALADGLGTVTAAALEQLVPSLADDVLACLLARLDPLSGASALSTWPQRRSGLARAILRRARVSGAVVLRSTITSLESGMAVRSWGSVDGVSDELQQAFDMTAARAADEPDQELRAMYETAKERIAAQRSDEMHRYDVDV